MFKCLKFDEHRSKGNGDCDRSDSDYKNCSRAGVYLTMNIALRRAKNVRMLTALLYNTVRHRCVVWWLLCIECRVLIHRNNTHILTYKHTYTTNIIRLFKVVFFYYHNQTQLQINERENATIITHADSIQITTRTLKKYHFKKLQSMSDKILGFEHTTKIRGFSMLHKILCTACML